jgi:hypothetical protein
MMLCGRGAVRQLAFMRQTCCPLSTSADGMSRQRSIVVVIGSNVGGSSLNTKSIARASLLTAGKKPDPVCAAAYGANPKAHRQTACRMRIPISQCQSRLRGFLWRSGGIRRSKT